MGLPELTESNFPALSEKTRKRAQWDINTAPSESDLNNSRVKQALEILRDLNTWSSDSPYSKTEFRNLIAKKHGISPRTTRRIEKRFEAKGLAGIRHTKDNKKPKISKEATDYAVGLVLKPEHRRFAKKEAHAIYQMEAKRKGWPPMAYSYFTYLCRIILHPALKEYRDGGILALDNMVRSILRTYANLTPLQIVVIDQHRMDIWCVDELTGKVIRVMVYMIQDLRTRMIVGLSISKDSYNSQMIGSALRVCVSCFGVFGNLYSDNGKPEISHYIKGIIEFLNTFGISWKEVDEDYFDLLNAEGDGDTTNTHRQINAKVKNAKSKLIERTFGVWQNIFFSKLKLPGFVKRLSDDIHQQELDQKEVKKLAEQGKLLTFSELVAYAYQAADIYNNSPHRGVLAEWKGTPKPREASPKDCLRYCFDVEKWRPNRISEELLYLAFMAAANRIVQKGMILLNKEYYVHDALLSLHGQRVSIRFDPMDYSEIQVFKDSKYICTALPVERSDMLDRDLIARKNAEKRKLCKTVIDEFKRLTAVVPDMRQYSQVPQSERVAALIGSDRKRRALENQELHKTQTPEEIEAGMRRMEELNRPQKKVFEVPPRPKFWNFKYDRYDWYLRATAAGTILSSEDLQWMREYEAAMTTGEREHAQFKLEFLQDEFKQTLIG